MNRRSFFKRIVGGLAAIPFLGAKSEAADTEPKKEMEELKSRIVEIVPDNASVPDTKVFASFGDGTQVLIGTFTGKFEKGE